MNFAPLSYENPGLKEGSFVMELAKTYDPRKVEEKWYKYWEENDLFHSEKDEENSPFTIVIPPPNITGILHMGHGLNNTIQDIIIRWKRMQGYNTLWLPGTDHAGIATQNVVEKQLSKEGKSRHEIGREAFIELVWKWREKYGSAIIKQLRNFGASCDWRRERFTMDEGLSRAVKEVFVRLYNDGLIYKGKYIINWCPRCQTALSDEEVEHEAEEGNLYYILYPFKDEEGGLVVATTRPETMLGDSAVAVNPNDERYNVHIGKTVILPLVGRELTVIGDNYVDTEFGTGALKITPAHDPDDFEIGTKHGLDRINIFNIDATVNENGIPDCVGMDRYECREAVLEKLKSTGSFIKQEPHTHEIGHCYRCHTVIEPYLSEQWFVRMKPLAEPAIKAVENGDTVFYPGRWKKVYMNWMTGIRDWCISRQIWWGHRIPVYYCDDCGEMFASVEEPSRCSACESSAIHQDEDVLDTWFSSQLWPFSTLGWPDENDDLGYYYPTSVLVTDPGILFFWVARMIMIGLKFMDRVPFKDVYIQPAAGDAGGAIGAAFYVWNILLGHKKDFILDHAYYGPQFDNAQFRSELEAKNKQIKEKGCIIKEFGNNRLCKQIAKYIADGKVVGWFQGRMEWGPRALGNRSIVCDPRRTDMKQILNLKINTISKEMGGLVFRGIESSDGNNLTIEVGTGRTPTDVIILRKVKGIQAAKAKMAIIVDDLGIKSLNFAQRLCNIEQDLTLSILPFQRHTSEVVDLANETGTPYILHMPMEPQSMNENPGEGAIYISDVESDIIEKLETGGLDNISQLENRVDLLEKALKCYREDMNKIENTMYHKYPELFGKSSNIEEEIDLIDEALEEIPKFADIK